MAEPFEDAVLLLDRSSRATRGKRIARLLDEELEEDEVFWNQDALKEEENDDNYEAEAEAADVFDSDFDDDEMEANVEDEKAVDEDKLPVKKRMILPWKPVPKKRHKKKDLSKLEMELEKEKSSEVKSLTDDIHHDVNDDLEGERSVRKSTRTSVIVRQAERDAIRAAQEASIKPMKRRKEGEEKRMTQEEMLLEAAETEIMNLRNLERVLAREEEVKKRATVHKAVYNGPQVRYISKHSKSFLEFSNGLTFSSELRTSSVSYPEKTVCVVTGLPAKYRDPKTGFPYATKEAFKVIRERFLEEELQRKKPVKMDMGRLLESLPVESFLHKKRSIRPRKATKSLDPLLGAWFRRTAAPDVIDLE